ncbi:MAG: hypothetical protein GY826_06345, partial [Fuerstiella sp.]|nr:hypothetical protein [Fuerstiella sp.]
MASNRPKKTQTRFNFTCSTTSTIRFCGKNTTGWLATCVAYTIGRSRTTFIELCKTPELACEVTVTAQKILGVDAAILFADLLPILEPMGIDLEYVKGEGPVIHNPLKEAGAVDRLVALDSVETLDYVFQAVKLIRAELPDDIPLLGFAGAPFTLASYCIEGGGSKTYVHT